MKINGCEIAIDTAEIRYHHSKNPILMKLYRNGDNRPQDN